ncbi:MFS transporter [Paenibacillus sp. HWE-109]|uniref:MFS transporter n=1 Tax=Paenibacillus sp. HWE-109 TaxID=1306526 RepID=UPI001EDD30F3|nr:MFS transporter [Paenibacillus sp. HWE-109]UKS27215.1 MFS transporter [Paenibacillus sp. HWE-109]
MSEENRLWNRGFVAVCFSSFFLFMTFYILAVTLPLFVTETLHGGQQQVGLVMTVFIFSTVIFRPLTGKWMDEWDRKKIVIAGLSLFILCVAMYPFVHQYYVLLGLRLIHGISFGMAATATGAIAIELVPERRKGEGIGYFSLFMSLAMVVGPFIGLTITQTHNNNLLFGVCILLGFLAFICGLFIRLPKRVVNTKVIAAKGWRKFIEPSALPISLTGSVLAFSYGAITTFLSVYAKAIGLESYASYFFMVFALAIVVSRPFIGKWFDHYGPNRLVYPGIILFTVGMIGLSLTQSSLLFLLVAVLLGLGFGALLPSFQTIAIQAAPAHRRGLATGTYYLLFDVGYGIGSYILGTIASKTNYHTMYFVAGLVVACSSILYYGLYHRKPAAMNSNEKPLLQQD